MQRLFGIAAIVGLIWLGASMFSGGGPPASLARFLPGGAAPPQPSSLERVRASGTAARDAQAARIERQLEPTPSADDGEE